MSSNKEFLEQLIVRIGPWSKVWP